MLLGVGVTIGNTEIYSSSMFSVELSLFTLGLNGGVISFLYNASQSISLNQGWFWISSKPLYPNRLVGSRSKSLEQISKASAERYCDFTSGAFSILRYLGMNGLSYTITSLFYLYHRMAACLLTFRISEYLMTTNPHIFHMTKSWTIRKNPYFFSQNLRS